MKTRSLVENYNHNFSQDLVYLRSMQFLWFTFVKCYVFKAVFHLCLDEGSACLLFFTFRAWSQASEETWSTWSPILTYFVRENMAGPRSSYEIKCLHCPQMCLWCQALFLSLPIFFSMYNFSWDNSTRSTEPFWWLSIKGRAQWSSANGTDVKGVDSSLLGCSLWNKMVNMIRALLLFNL